MMGSYIRIFSCHEGVLGSVVDGSALIVAVISVKMESLTFLHSSCDMCFFSEAAISVSAPAGVVDVVTLGSVGSNSSGGESASFRKRGGVGLRASSSSESMISSISANRLFFGGVDGGGDTAVWALADGDFFLSMVVPLR